MSTIQMSARKEWARRLGTALATARLLSPDVVQQLVDEAVENGAELPVLLIERGILPASTVVTTLARVAQLPAVDLQSEHPAPEVEAALPVALAEEYDAVAFRAAGSQLVVVFAEPPSPDDVRALGAQIGYQVVAALGDPTALRALRQRGEDGSDGSNGSNGVHGAHVARGANGANGANKGTAMQIDVELPLHVDDLLRRTVSMGASDLHLTASMPPTVRLHGALRALEGFEPLDSDTLRDLVYAILPQSQRERFEDEHELDTSHTIVGVGRFRVNVSIQRATVAVALRPIPHDVPEFSTLGVPDSVAGFANLRRGLVLVTGPTGSGKSTTLASLVDMINRNRPLHVVTVEDPIEFLHEHKRSIISQREVGSDTTSFAEALRRALRQDPDVILVGEMRDLETISTAITAAETGHLVFATLHTQDAPSTIDRVIDVFPPNQQEQIRIQLSSALAGVVTQQLVPTADGAGRCVASEVLVCTPAIQNLIRAAKTHQIYSLMQTGAQYGMQTMDQSLAALVRDSRVSQSVAADRCRNEEDFRNHLMGR